MLTSKTSRCGTCANCIGHFSNKKTKKKLSSLPCSSPVTTYVRPPAIKDKAEETISIVSLLERLGLSTEAIFDINGRVIGREQMKSRKFGAASSRLLTSSGSATNQRLLSVQGAAVVAAYRAVSPPEHDVEEGLEALFQKAYPISIDDHDRHIAALPPYVDAANRTLRLLSSGNAEHGNVIGQNASLLVSTFSRGKIKTLFGIVLSDRQFLDARKHFEHSGVSGNSASFAGKKNVVSESDLQYAVEFMCKFVTLLPWGYGRKIFYQGIPKYLPAGQRSVNLETLCRLYNQSIAIHGKETQISRSLFRELALKSSSSTLRCVAGVDTNDVEYGSETFVILREELMILVSVSPKLATYHEKLAAIVDRTESALSLMKSHLLSWRKRNSGNSAVCASHNSDFTFSDKNGKDSTLPSYEEGSCSAESICLACSASQLLQAELHRALEVAKGDVESRRSSSVSSADQQSEQQPVTPLGNSDGSVLNDHASKELAICKTIIERSLKRIHHNYLHKIHGAAEEPYREEALEWLKGGKPNQRALMVGDFKMKITPILAKESQARYFGKIGMIIHGTMIVWYDVESATFKSWFFLQPMDSSTDEDAIAAGTAMRAAAEEFKEMPGHEDFEEIKSKCDGAHAYSSLNLLRSLLSVHGVKFIDNTTGSSGDGKTELDGMYGPLVDMIMAIVAQGQGTMDVINAKTLARALMQSRPKHTSVQYLKSPSKVVWNERFESETLYKDQASNRTTRDKIPYTKCSQKTGVYDESGVLTGIILRRQYDLGGGLFIPKGDVMGEDSPVPAAERMEIPPASATFLANNGLHPDDYPIVTVAGTPSVTTAGSAGTNASVLLDATALSSITSRTTTGRKKNPKSADNGGGVFKTHENRSTDKAKKSVNRKNREDTAKKNLSNQMDARDEEVKNSNLFFCCEKPKEEGGDEKCVKNYLSEQECKRHISNVQKGTAQHSYYEFGNPLSNRAPIFISAYEKGCAMIYNHLTMDGTSIDFNFNSVRRKETEDENIVKHDHTYTLFDGSSYKIIPVKQGFSIRKNFTSEYFSYEQIEAAYHMKKMGDDNIALKFNPTTARECMRDLGKTTSSSIGRSREQHDEYFSRKSENGEPFFPRDQVLTETRLRKMFSRKTSELKQQLDNITKAAHKRKSKGDKDEMDKKVKDRAKEEGVKAIYEHKLQESTKTDKLGELKIYEGLGDTFWKGFKEIAPNAKDIPRLTDEEIEELLATAMKKAPPKAKYSFAIEHLRRYYPAVALSELMNLADDDEEIENQRREEDEAENNLNGEESTDLIEDTNNNAFCS